MHLHINDMAVWLNYLGISVFAATGALVAARKRLDIIAAWYFALVTAVGGGTVRDLLIGAPVFWMHEPASVILCTIVTLSVWSVPLPWWPSRTLEWMDAAGLAAYSVYGASKALQYGVLPVSAVAAGVITACIGGMIRDITLNVPSIIIRNEIYVTASLLSAGLFVILLTSGVSIPVSVSIAGISGFALRGAAIYWRLSLPVHRGK